MLATATKHLDNSGGTVENFSVASIADRRPAPAEAVFSCLGGAVYTTSSPRDAELCQIEAWVDQHGATTKVSRPVRISTTRKTRPGPAPKAGDRYACGKLKPVAETATAEHQAKRRALVGIPLDAPNSSKIARHEALASTPMGVLKERGQIMGGDLKAGLRYLRLFAAASGSLHLLRMPSMLGNLVANGGHGAAMALLHQVISQEKHPITGAMVTVGTWDREQYLAAREALEKRGAHVAHAVDDLVIYENPPRSEKRLEAIIDGLDALKIHFDEADARRRRA